LTSPPFCSSSRSKSAAICGSPSWLSGPQFQRLRQLLVLIRQLLALRVELRLRPQDPAHLRCCAGLISDVEAGDVEIGLLKASGTELLPGCFLFRQSLLIGKQRIGLSLFFHDLQGAGAVGLGQLLDLELLHAGVELGFALEARRGAERLLLGRVELWRRRLAGAVLLVAAGLEVDRVEQIADRAFFRQIARHRGELARASRNIGADRPDRCAAVDSAAGFRISWPKPGTNGLVPSTPIKSDESGSSSRTPPRLARY
jgi:hypothetical protein